MLTDAATGNKIKLKTPGHNASEGVIFFSIYNLDFQLLLFHSLQEVLQNKEAHIGANDTIGIPTKYDFKKQGE